MTDTSGDSAPAWVARFLDGLRAGNGVRAACRAAGVVSSTAYTRRDRDEGFRRAWDAIQPVDDRRGRRSGSPARRDAARIERFLDELAQTSNVAAAAAVADLPVSRIYRLRRTATPSSRGGGTPRSPKATTTSRWSCSRTCAAANRPRGRNASSTSQPRCAA